MRNNAVKLTAWLLAVLVLLLSASMVSCADTGEENDQTTAQPAVIDTDPITDEATLLRCVLTLYNIFGEK